MTYVPEGIATTDGRTVDVANAARCALESLSARIQLQDAQRARDVNGMRDAAAQLQEWATQTNRRGARE